MLLSKVFRHIALCFLLFLSAQAKAVLIVDTGTHTPSPYWDFNATQYFAGQFSIGEAFTLNSVESYFGVPDHDGGAAGSVTVAIHSDDGNIPDATIFSEDMAIPKDGIYKWRGVFGLAWELTAGTYWVSFTPDSAILGAMPGGAASPLAQYADNRGSGWGTTGVDSIGYRIAAEPTVVPEPASLALMGLGLAGIGWSRKVKAPK